MTTAAYRHPDVLIGNRRTFVFSFTKDGVATDPTAVSIKVLHPDDSTTTHAATNDAPVGQWSYDLTFNSDGQWGVRAEGTGAVVAAVDVLVKVLPSLVLTP